MFGCLSFCFLISALRTLSFVFLLFALAFASYYYGFCGVVSSLFASVLSWNKFGFLWSCDEFCLGSAIFLGISSPILGFFKQIKQLWHQSYGWCCNKGWNGRYWMKWFVYFTFGFRLRDRTSPSATKTVYKGENQIPYGVPSWFHSKQMLSNCDCGFYLYGSMGFMEPPQSIQGYYTCNINIIYGLRSTDLFWLIGRLVNYRSWAKSNRIRNVFLFPPTTTFVLWGWLLRWGIDGLEVLIRSNLVGKKLCTMRKRTNKGYGNMDSMEIRLKRYYRYRHTYVSITRKSNNINFYEGIKLEL